MFNCARSRLLLRKPTATRWSSSSADAETPSSFFGKVIVAVARPRFSLVTLTGISAISWFIGVRYGQNVEKRWRELEAKEDSPAPASTEPKEEQGFEADKLKPNGNDDKKQATQQHTSEEPRGLELLSVQRRREIKEALRAATSEEERAKLYLEIAKKKEEKWQQAHLEAERKRQAALEALRKI